MRTTNLRLKRRQHFNRIIMIIAIELLIFGILVYNMLSPDNISVSETMGRIVFTFIIGCFLNVFWLRFIEDYFFFNKDKILNNIAIKIPVLTTNKEILQKALTVILDEENSPIYTKETSIIWKKLRMRYYLQDDTAIIDSIRKEVNYLYDELYRLEEKKEFFLKTTRENLWMYFKSKIDLAIT